MLEKLIDGFLPELIRIRRHLHQYPELAGEEFAAASLIRERLAKTEISLEPPYLTTDVVGMLEGKSPGPNVTLRADMDALPLEERNDLEYKSKYKGKMHACGHDAHAAILLGTALVLNELRDSFDGSVRFVFQPGEEVAGLGRNLIAAGAIDHPLPKAIFALHVRNGLKTGLIQAKPGIVTAYSEFFQITIACDASMGKAIPLADTVAVGNLLVQALTRIPNDFSPKQPVLVPVCRFSAGSNANVAPTFLTIEGSIRYLDPMDGEQLRALIKKNLEDICGSHGFWHNIEFSPAYDPVINAPEYFELVKETAVESFGREFFEEYDSPAMSGEDFSFFLHKAPGIFFRLFFGETCGNSHGPYYNFNDDALKTGIIMMTRLVLKTLGSRIK